MQYRARARATPLTAGFRFQWTFPERDVQNVPKRALPALLRGGDTLQCELVDRIQCDTGGKPQVWLARLLERSNWSAIDGTFFVVKIFQPSLMRLPDPRRGHSQPDYHNPEYLARNEAATYEHLTELQGESIPYLFGFDKIETPSHETALMLVMEYINGVSFKDIMSHCPPDDLGVEHYHTCTFDELCWMYKSLHERLRAVHSHDILHFDTALRNVIVMKSAPSVVLVDFNSSRSNSQYLFFHERQKYRTAVLECCECCMTELDLWALQHVPGYQQDAQWVTALMKRD